MDMSRYRELFLSETREHLSRMGELLVALEQQPSGQETIDALFREAHSIKAMAFSMGYEQTAALAHHLEDALDGFRRGCGVTVGVVDRLLAGLDLLEGLLEDLQDDRPERDITAFLAIPIDTPAPIADNREAPSAGPEPKPDGGRGTAGAAEAMAEPSAAPAEAPPAPPVGVVFQVTVTLAEDTMVPAARCLLILRELERAGEIISAAPTRETLLQGGPHRQVQVWLRTVIPKPRLEETLRAIAEVSNVAFVDDRRTDRRRVDAERSVRVRVDLLDQMVRLTGELLTHRFLLQRAAAAHDWDKLTAALGHTTQLIGDLHQQVLQARLVPFESITGRLPRLARDLAHKTGKQVEFRLTGGEVVLDRLILEELSDSLGHLVSNAIDHGIEAGKPGEVTVAARREKDLVLIEVSDNGRGMDSYELRRQAVARGFLTTAQVDRFSDREALLLVCIPGFSTAKTVTGTSGRGVGMDVVKASVERLGGTLDIQSRLGAGTCFQLRLPLSMAIIKVLPVSCGGHLLALPLTRVQQTLELPAEAVYTTGQRRFLRFDGEEVELVALDGLLGLAGGAATGRLCVVLSEMPNRRVGIQVDRFLDERDAFVKALGFPLDRLPGLSGATVEEDGNILFIIDPHPLLEGQVATPFRSKESFDVLS
jgi:two-component system chemotaxis sensor kinase CheA